MDREQALRDAGGFIQMIEVDADNAMVIVRGIATTRAGSVALADHLEARLSAGFRGIHGRDLLVRRSADRLSVLVCGEVLPGREPKGVAEERRSRMVTRLSRALSPKSCEWCGCADSCPSTLCGNVDPDVIPCKHCGCHWCGPPTLAFRAQQLPGMGFLGHGEGAGI